jgi:hypothetical protein
MRTYNLFLAFLRFGSFLPGEKFGLSPCRSVSNPGGVLTGTVVMKEGPARIFTKQEDAIHHKVRINYDVNLIVSIAYLQ